MYVWMGRITISGLIDPSSGLPGVGDIGAGAPGIDTFIFIYGPPGSGKSAVGAQLAQDLNLTFVDLDLEIEARAGADIPTIFAQSGEAGFRSLEAQALQAALSGKPGVLALGGGALLEEKRRRQVLAAGRVVCLQAALPTLQARLGQQGGQRPLLEGRGSDALEQLLERRAVHYAGFPLQVKTDERDPQQISRLVQTLLGRFHLRSMGAGYDVLVVPGGLAAVGESLRRRGLGGPVALVADGNLEQTYAHTVAQSLRKAGYETATLGVPPGEGSKSLAQVERLWAAFLDSGVDRSSMVVALGGGVTGDLAGFAAATYLRGVAWVNLPTTLLAMVDASLGGKTGIDLPEGKNLAGAFHAPRLVVADPDALQTLPQPELRAGLAEVVKHGVIGDQALFDQCARGWPALNEDWEQVVRRSMAVKVAVLEDDPYESGRRALLNLGHTLGHAVEHASGLSLRHGEAVAIGLVAEARLAERLSLASDGLAARIAQVLEGLELPVSLPAGLAHRDILEALRLDKKKRGGRVWFALPRAIGDVQLAPVEDLDLALSALEG